MVVVLEEQGIAFFGIPKAAGTSIYLALYAAQHGKPWSGPEMEIHRLYNTLPAPPDIFEACRNYWKFTVVRDPVKRLLSAYQNRVIDLGDLERVFGSTLRARFGALRRGLRTRPSASAFFERYEEYARFSFSMRQHTRSVRDFIGADLGYFDAVYTMSDLPNLSRDLSQRFGREIALPQGNQSERATAFGDLSALAQQRILDLTRPDYEFLSRYFSPPVPSRPQARAQSH